MSYIGITVLLITTISLLLVFIFNKYIKIVTRSYWFYSVISLLFLVYFITIRYVNSIETMNNYDMDFLKINDPYTYSFIFSKVLLLDLCPMISFLLPLSLIFDRTRNLAKVLSLFGIIGGLVTIYGNMIFIKEINISLAWFIFIGEDPNYLMFSSHYFILILSILVILNSNCFTKWSFMGAVIFVISFITYVLVVSYILNIESNTTGLRKGDWINPYEDKFWYSQYGTLYKLIPLSYEFSIFFWYLIAFIIIVLVMISKNWLNNDIRNIPQFWYRKINFIKTDLYKIDIYINTFLYNFDLKMRK